jgi:eukaryotic-like serine/threonine-protein kinase
LNSYWLPAVEASLDLRTGNTQAAISALQIAAPYEMSQASALGDEVFMYPTYIRGEAYLAANDGTSAVVEFKKITDHPGVVLNCILGSLARLQLARAEAMMGNKRAALKDYVELFSSWKDADRDVPILMRAKAEYRKLTEERVDDFTPLAPAKTHTGSH